MGGKQKDVDSFVDQLKSEGQEIISPAKKVLGTGPGVSSAGIPGMKMESVHVRCEEKLTVALNRNGGVENFEINGVMSLKVTDAQYRTVKVKIENHSEKKWRGIQLQISNCSFNSEGTVKLKIVLSSNFTRRNNFFIILYVRIQAVSSIQNKRTFSFNQLKNKIFNKFVSFTA